MSSARRAHRLTDALRLQIIIDVYLLGLRRSRLVPGRVDSESCGCAREQQSALKASRFEVSAEEGAFAVFPCFSGFFRDLSEPSGREFAIAMGGIWLKACWRLSLWLHR